VEDGDEERDVVCCGRGEREMGSNKRTAKDKTWKKRKRRKMETNFELTRFQVYGLLFNRTGGTTSEFSDTLEEQETFSNEIKRRGTASSSTLAVQLGTESAAPPSPPPSSLSSSSATPVEAPSLSSSSGVKKTYEEVGGTITRVRIGEEKRFVLRIWFEEHRHISLIVSDRTTAKQTCAIGAKKLHLDQFFFGLFALRNGTGLCFLLIPSFRCLT